MIRKSTLNIGYANHGKLALLDLLFDESKKVINLFIDKLWERQDFKSKFANFKFEDTWLSSRLQQALGKQALEIVKSQRKREKKTKPVFTKNTINLDSRFVDFQFNTNTFDMWIRLASLGSHLILKLPSKRHKHFNKFEGFELLRSIRLRKVDNKYLIEVFFKKDELKKKTEGQDLGIDIGYKKLIACSDGRLASCDFEGLYNKIANKKQGSKSFKRSLIERNNLINEELNKLDLSNIKTIVVEALKNVKHKTKGQLTKSFVNKLQRWSYPKVLSKLSSLSESLGINFVQVDQSYTSQTCSNCGHVDKKSRKGEDFKCTCCNMEMDADINASINILRRGVYSPSTTQNQLIETVV